MRIASVLLLLTGLLGLTACGSSDPEPLGPEIVTRAYIEAWCRDDGSHTAFEFTRDRLPPVHFEQSATLMDFPRGVPVVRIDLERTSYIGPGEIESLGEENHWVMRIHSRVEAQSRPFLDRNVQRQIRNGLLQRINQTRQIRATRRARSRIRVWAPGFRR